MFEPLEFKPKPGKDGSIAEPLVPRDYASRLEYLLAQTPSEFIK